jgi:hypothetical protein
VQLRFRTCCSHQERIHFADPRTTTVSYGVGMPRLEAFLQCRCFRLSTPKGCLRASVTRRLGWAGEPWWSFSQIVGRAACSGFPMRSMGRERPVLRMGVDAEFRSSSGCCTQEDDSTTQNRFCWAWLVGAVLLILWLLGFGLNVAAICVPQYRIQSTCCHDVCVWHQTKRCILFGLRRAHPRIETPCLLLPRIGFSALMTKLPASSSDN